MDIVKSLVPSCDSEQGNTQMHQVFNNQKSAYQRNPNPSANTRIDRINRVIDLITSNQKELINATSVDFGHRSSHQAQIADIMATLNSLKYSRDHLKDWMKADTKPVMKPLSWFGARAKVHYQPKGVVGNLSTWNFPVYVSLVPLAGILAAGNHCMIKLSELTPATSELTFQLLQQYFDESEVAGVLGGPEAGAEFSSLPFDHLMFTGGTHIGRSVMRSASANLTPVTLELGGKSPVVISRSADLKMTAERIINGKIINMGQVCLSPDYCFVPEESRDELVQHMKDHFGNLFPTYLNNPDCTSVVNQRHYQRILDYLEDAVQKGAQVEALNPAGESHLQQKKSCHRLPLHLVWNVNNDMKIMQQEIFGPAICIQTYRSMDEAVNYINAHPRPLALYYFGRDATEERRMVEETHSGGIAINDVMTHVSCEELPFGGIGPSGMGYYHGHEGFLTFSHKKSVYRQSRVNFMALAGMLPPYTNKLQKRLDSMTNYPG